jgi:CRP-like cAMP-binding protein
MAAWRDSFLGSLGPSVEPLLDDAEELHFESGETLRRVDASKRAFLAIVISGVVRVAAASPEGRRATARYLGASDTLGLPQTLAPGVIWPHQIFQAVTDASLLKLNPDRFWSLVATKPEYLKTVYHEVVRALSFSYELLTENVFAHVRHRVARHLLDLSTRENGELVVHASQQDLADSIGSVREVVSRTLSEFKSEGIIRRDRKAYVLTDPARLHRIAARQE